MRLKLIIGGLMLNALSLAGCQKDITESPDFGQQTIARSFAVSGEEWVEDKTRSGYDPSLPGIKLTGDENISVFYCKFTTTGATAELQDKVIAAPGTTRGDYSFSHPAISGTEAYNYYFVMPNLSFSKVGGSTRAQTYHRLSPVQLPEANSFDPDYDYLIGLPQENLSQQTALSLTQFKRFFTPLRIDITDGSNVFAGEKIRAATISFAATASQTQNLAGLFYVNYSTNFAECKVNSWFQTSETNALTALYPEGLPAAANAYPVWFMVNPTTIPAGNLTVTVSTDTKTITRTTALPLLNVNPHQVNHIGFNVSGTGYTEEKSFTQDFSTFSNPSADMLLQAGDGNAYTWNMAGARAWTDSEGTLPNALRMNASTSITLPRPTGITGVTKLRIVQHANNYTNNAQLELWADGTKVGGPYEFGYYGTLAKSGGICEIDIPAADQGKTLVLKNTGTNPCFISSITAVYTGTIVAVDENDYLDMYNKGYDIVIGGITINKTNYPIAATVTNASNMIAAIRTGGVIFVDSNTPDATPNRWVMSSSGFVTKETILIGRYVDSQPTIQAYNGTTGFYIAVRCADTNFICKNLGFDAPYTNDFLLSSDAGSTPTGRIAKVVIEDCSFALKGNLLNDQGKEHWIANTVIANSIVKFYGDATGKALYYAAGNTGGSAGTRDIKKANAAELESITLTNNIVYAAGTPSAMKFSLVFIDNASSEYNTANAIVSAKNNSLYNIWHGNGMISCYNAKSMEFSYNVGVLDGGSAAKSSYCIGYGGTDPVGANITVSFTRNYCYSTDATNKWKNYWQTSAGKVSNVSGTPGEKGSNSLALAASPLLISNIADPANQGDYMPVVSGSTAETAGAGASYTTKRWKTWE